MNLFLIRLPLEFAIDSERWPLLSSLSLFLFVAAILMMLVSLGKRKKILAILCGLLMLLCIITQLLYRTGFRVRGPKSPESFQVVLHWHEDLSDDSKEEKTKILSAEEAGAFFSVIEKCRWKRNLSVWQNSRINKASPLCSVEIQNLENGQSVRSYAIQIGTAWGSYNNELWVTDDEPLLTWWKEWKTENGT